MHRALVPFAIVPLLLTLCCRAGEIHDAVHKHERATLDRLLEKDSSLVRSRCFPDYKTPLHVAADVGDPALAKS